MKRKLIYSIKKRKQINELLDSFDLFFCLKNHERTILFQTEDSGRNAAEINMNEKYNRITIKIFPCFLTNTLEDQRMFLLHEMCHTLIRPVQEEAQNMINGKLCTQDQLNFSVENATSKVTYLLDIMLLGARQYMKDAYKKYAGSITKKVTKKKIMKTPASKAKMAVAKKAMPAMKKGSAKKSK